MRIRIGDGAYDAPVRLSEDGRTLERMDIDTGEWRPTKYTVGAVGTLKRVTDIKHDIVRYSLDFSGEFIPGNMNPAIRRFHGWRGTSFDQEVYALGVRRIKSMRRLKSGAISVELSNDLSPDLP